MKRANHNKLKLIKLIEMFERDTDEQHHLSMRDILRKLEANGLSAERKSIYSDVAFLQDIGFDIEIIKGSHARYHLVRRLFELPELKLLVDAVHSSRFITEAHSKKIIDKLMTLVSRFQEKELNRQIYVTQRPKSLNKTTLYSIDEIHHAINERQQISFKYFYLNTKKKREYRKEELTIHSPLALCWDNDKYYCLCYNEKYNDVNSYRVDRMENVVMLDKKWHDAAYDIDIDSYIKGMFGMFSGEKIRAILEFDNSLVNSVTDVFGMDVAINENGDKFSVNVVVSKSNVFFSWLMQFGTDARIVSPDSLRESMAQLLKETLSHYS